MFGQKNGKAIKIIESSSLSQSNHVQTSQETKGKTTETEANTLAHRLEQQLPFKPSSSTGCMGSGTYAGRERMLAQDPSKNLVECAENRRQASSSCGCIGRASQHRNNLGIPFWNGKGEG
ncbi:UNVERIFIED_CONTAM: hypothetical protein K2H54_049594 [Gekko kuhli]